MGNSPCCCNLRHRSSPSAAGGHGHGGGERRMIFAKRNSCYMAMNKDEAVVGGQDVDKFIKFGPMLLKEPPCKIALLVAASVDDGFFTMQNMLAKGGWQSAVAASEEEAEERFTKLWPHLIVVDARKSTGMKQKKPAFCLEEMIRKLRSLTEDDGTVILAVVDKLTCEDRQQRILMEAGVSKLLKCCPRALADELVWIERCVLPLQHRLRSCAALFTALEHMDCAVEITSYNRVVQYVNSTYEQLTGCHRDDVLGTLSSDLRRKSLPKETATAGVGASTATTIGPIKVTMRTNDQRKTRTVSAGAVALSGPTTSTAGDGEEVGSDRIGAYVVNNEANRFTRPSSPRPASSLPTTTLTEAVAQAGSSSEAQAKDGYDITGWRCVNAPGPSNQHQFVYMKNLALCVDGAKSGFYRRTPSKRFSNAAVDTPVTEIIAILRDVQKRCGNDEEIQNPIQKVVKILNSTELYSPLITRFKQGDKVASDLFGGLVLNGPVSWLHRSRKTSLSETMRTDTHHRSSRSESGMLRCTPDVRATLQLEESWQFDIFELERLTFRKPLVHLGMKIFQRWRVDGFLQCSESCLRSWLEVMEAHYHADNSYHNSTHAADVMQATAYYLGKENVANMIEHADAVAALLASVVHDLDHPGKGSAFLINTRHPLALLYNDVSVLESHHAALSFQLSLADPRMNIFARLSRQDFMSLRKSVVDMVLATDMNKHFEYLAKFQQTILVEEDDTGTPPPEKDRTDPRRIVCRLLIKCADVSNPSRPWNQCKEWAYRIVEEYFVQTAEERAKGLPLTMEVFDRDTCNVPLTQCSFIEMFIREMFRSWCKFGRMPELLVHVEENYRRWQDEAKIWPKQRMLEYSRIQAYLRHRDSYRHIMAGAMESRPSVDSIGSAPPALVTIAHHSSKDGSSEQQPLLETTIESPVQIGSPPELV